jgi:molecular chaperone Hsp33
MQDVLLRGLLPDAGLRVLFVRAGDTARMARMLHGLAPTSAAVFGEALAAGLLLGALQKDRTRVNLSLEVDGPISGLLVDADTDGNVRGRVRQPEVHFPGDPSIGPRAALGGSGTLSVLRDMGAGEFYRGSVEFVPGTLTENLRRYFAESEQVGSALDVRVLPVGAEPLGEVAGLLVQRLPEGDGEALEQVRRRMADGALREALALRLPAAETVRRVVGPELQVLAELEVSYTCACSRERAVNAVTALGLAGIRSVLEQERELVIDCEFCRKRYVIPEEELRAIARAMARRDGGAKA